MRSKSRYSAQRVRVFQAELDLGEDAQAGMHNIINLQSLCEIRWSSSANALYTFKSAFTDMVTGLEYLEDGRAKPDAICCPSC